MRDKYIAYCGLYCRDCLRHNSDIATTAEKLKNEIDRQHFSSYVDVKKKHDDGFSKYPDFIAMLDKIIDLKCEKPCREGSGCSAFECQILACCKNKEFEGCWECEQFENCAHFNFLKPYHGKGPQENLRLIRDKGIDAIEANRHKFYVWEE